MNLNNKKRAFTIIDILLVLFIMGLLAAIVLSIGIASGRDKASINSYRTTMNSLQAAMELCGDGNRISGLGVLPGNNVCADGYDNVKYPEIESRCGAAFKFNVFDDGTPNWFFSTDEDCKGCKVYCDVEGCRTQTNFDCD